MLNTVLLTGTTGFLGKYLYKSLQSKYKVETLGRNVNNNLVCDLKKEIPEIKITYKSIIHSAGKAHSIPKTQKEKDDFFDVNYKGTVNLCKALEKHIPENFIFISTIAVYGLEKGNLLDENTPLKGSTPYAKSKIKAELYLQKWAFKNKINLVILRLPLVAGKNPKGNLASMINGIKKGYYFNIKNSNAKKSIVLAKDVSELILNLENKNGIYNLSGDKNYTFKEISQIIAKQLNKNKVWELPYFLIKFVSYFGNLFPKFPINSNKLDKIINNLTVSDKKARLKLNWKPKNLNNHFKI